MEINKQKSISFVEWVAKEHYYLYNIHQGFCIWKNGDSSIPNKTTKELYNEFEKNIPLYEADFKKGDIKITLNSKTI